MSETRRYAADCRFLQRTFDSTRDEHFVTLCRHILRDGDDCVGPFLDDTETPCGLWELRPKDGAAAPWRGQP